MACYSSRTRSSSCRIAGPGESRGFDRRARDGNGLKGFDHAFFCVRVFFGGFLDQCQWSQTCVHVCVLCLSPVFVLVVQCQWSPWCPCTVCGVFFSAIGTSSQRENTTKKVGGHELGPRKFQAHSVRPQSAWICRQCQGRRHRLVQSLSVLCSKRACLKVGLPTKKMDRALKKWIASSKKWHAQVTTRTKSQTKQNVLSL